MPANVAPGFSRTLYNTFFKRNSVFVTTIFTSAFVFSVGFNSVADNAWDKMNKGKQWKDIKEKYEN